MAVQRRIDEGGHVVAGDGQVGLEQSHLHVRHERSEELPALVHIVQVGAHAGGAGRGQPGTDAEPARHELARLRPAEHPRDSPQPLEPLPGAAAAGGAGADVHLGQFLHRRGRPEVLDKAGSLQESSVGLVGRARGCLHHMVPSAGGGRVVARGPVRHRRLDDGGEGKVEVAVGQPGQPVLVGDHLALLGDLDRAAHRAGRLAQDRRVSGPSAPADGASPPVEHRHPHAGGR